jgi:lipopolysaccharide transport system ATP-binding protein
MSDIAIQVDSLGKQYRIGGKREGYKTLRDSLTNAFVSPFRRARKLLQGHAYGAAELDETIWALRDISLEVKRGEVVGIIGRNGAGKTTLLKILSRITEPTEGQAEIRGRVGSLLEVGTGFHPELTGRENIYLNGAILGMRKAAIEQKFDEIVDFAEIEKFVDTPVKHYSSGMYVRLAFAVAAHLEPEVLLVDEVLAVGDLGFQRKCLGKMSDVAREGRTVLFVSHNLAAVKHLCQTGIVLDSGRIVHEGTATEAVHAYRSLVQGSGLDATTKFLLNRQNWHPQPNQILLHDIRLGTGTEDGTPRTGEPMTIELVIETTEPMSQLGFSIRFRSDDEVSAVHTSTQLDRDYKPSEVFGRAIARLEIDCLLLTSGFYNLDVGIVRPKVEVISFIQNAARMYVGEGDFFQVGIPLTQKDCLAVMNHKWSVDTFQS